MLFYLKAEILKRAEVEILKTGSSSENVSALAYYIKNPIYANMPLKKKLL